jgi:hypothetical protein
MEHNFNKRYIGRFVGICLVLFIVMAFLPLPGIFNLLIAMGTAFYLGRLFAKDHSRLPTPSEQNRFAGFAFLALVGIVGLLTTVLLMGLPPEEQNAFFAPFREKSVGVMIFGTFLAILMMWGSIHFGFGLGGRVCMKSLEKEKAGGV